MRDQLPRGRGYSGRLWTLGWPHAYKQVSFQTLTSSLMPPIVKSVGYPQVFAQAFHLPNTSTYPSVRFQDQFWASKAQRFSICQNITFSINKTCSINGGNLTCLREEAFGVGRMALIIWRKDNKVGRRPSGARTAAVVLQGRGRAEQSESWAKKELAGGSSPNLLFCRPFPHQLEAGSGFAEPPPTTNLRPNTSGLERSVHLPVSQGRRPDRRCG